MMVVGAHTVFVAEVMLGLTARPHGAVGEQHTPFSNCGIAVGFQGGAIRAAQAYQQAGGVPLLMGLRTGPDPRGDLLTNMIVHELPNKQRILGRTSTRQSIGVSDHGRSGLAATSTIRNRIDDSHVRTEPWSNSSKRLVMASMTAQQSPLVHRLIETHPREPSLLMTSSQCKAPDKTVELASKCALVQLDANDLEAMTGIRRDVASGINYLRDNGVEEVIVTEGKRGITAFLDDEWHHQPSFIVEKCCRAGNCEDITFGTYFWSTGVQVFSSNFLVVTDFHRSSLDSA